MPAHRPDLAPKTEKVEYTVVWRSTAFAASPEAAAVGAVLLFEQVRAHVFNVINNKTGERSVVTLDGSARSR